MDAITIPSVLDAVTVHAEGAICTRLATVEPVDGHLPPLVRVTGLPLALRPEMLRARVLSGPEDLRVKEVRSGFITELTPELDVDAERAALEQAEDALARLLLSRTQVQQEIDAISALRPEFPEPRRKEPVREAPVGAIASLAEVVAGDLAGLHARLRKLDQEVHDARNEVDLRQKRLAESSTAKRVEQARLNRVALVSLTSSHASCAVQLAVEYLVPGARWVPSYDLKLDRSMNKGVLRMRAVVAQRSGEDWRNVRLGLSTANLERRTDVPELRSLRIGRAQPPPPRSGWRDPPPGLDDLFGDFDRAWLPRVPDSNVDQFYAPPPKAEPAKTVELRLDRKKEKAGRPSVAPTAMATGGACPAPPAAPMSISAPRAAASSVRMPSREKSRGAARRDLGGVDDDAPCLEEAAEDFDGVMLGAADKAFMQATVLGGLDLPGAPEVPASTMDVAQVSMAMQDYSLLMLAGAQEGSHRGRLQPQDRDRLDLVMATSVSVQVDVLLAVLGRQRQEAQGVQGLTLPIHAQTVRETAGSYDYRYDAEHRLDIDSDGAWHSVPIMTANVALVPGYVTVPLLDNKVFRSVMVHNNSPHALLSGPVDVTLGDEFLMTVKLPTVPPQGEERMGLGVEEAISVARNTRFKESTGGLLGGSMVLQQDVDLELVNRLGHAVDVEVRERIPVTEEDDIKIEEASSKPPWKPDGKIRDGVHAKGIRVWNVHLDSGGKCNLSAQFVIKLPNDKMLVGGNRRA